MKDNLISVIVPVYNVEAFLPRCLNSIANQTYRNLEIILVDDGSTDGSGRICDEYAAVDHRARVIHQTNKGLWAARNAGQDSAKGDFLFFPDSDDYFHFDMIRMMHEAISRDDGYDVAIVNMKQTAREDESCNEIIDCNWFECQPGQLVSRLIVSRYPYSNIWNKLYRTSAIKELRARPYPIAQDLDYLLQAFQHFRRAICSEQVLYYWFSHRGQITEKAQYYKVLPDIFYTNYVENLSGRCSYDYIVLDFLYRKMSLLKARSIKTGDKDTIFNKCKQYYKRTISNYLHEKRIPVKVKATYILGFNFPYAAFIIYKFFEHYPHLYKQLS